MILLNMPTCVPIKVVTEMIGTAALVVNKTIKILSKKIKGIVFIEFFTQSSLQFC